MSAPVEPGTDLRALIRAGRKDPSRWGKPRGLSQAEAAAKVGISQVWWRQIETGYTPTAAADTLAAMCDMLDIDQRLIRGLGYPDVADAMDAIEIRRSNSIPARMVDAGSAEDHIRSTPGLDKREADTLVNVLRAMRGREEPFGKDMWRARS